MIKPKEFFQSLGERGVDFYCGVPDSLLANFCAYVDDKGGRERHLITANEGNAIALALGFHLATRKMGAVYMQNSGLGNAVNPLASLADPEVYKVPMLLLVGWRGEPGEMDEPQHIKQGLITLDQLKILDIPFWILDANSPVDSVLDEVFKSLQERNGPVAIVVRKDTFAEYEPQNAAVVTGELMREAALEGLLSLCGQDDLVVATTGKTSRELYELRKKTGQPQRDFLTVGGMGHTASIALGVKIGLPDRRVVCIDGDGSLIMHMGALPVIAKYQPHNFLHVLLNNCAHESVGGQATSADKINFEGLADSIGYAGYALAEDLDGLRRGWETLSSLNGPVLLEVKIRVGSRADLGRPDRTAEQNKLAFMEFANGS